MKRLGGGKEDFLYRALKTLEVAVPEAGLRKR